LESAKNGSGGGTRLHASFQSARQLTRESGYVEGHVMLQAFRIQAFRLKTCGDAQPFLPTAV
jgi:hypothetical protein